MNVESGRFICVPYQIPGSIPLIIMTVDGFDDVILEHKRFEGLEIKRIAVTGAYPASLGDPRHTFIIFCVLINTQVDANLVLHVFGVVIVQEGIDHGLSKA